MVTAFSVTCMIGSVNQLQDSGVGVVENKKVTKQYGTN